MRSTKLFALSFLLVSGASMALAASSVPGEPAVPVGARLEQYRLEPGGLSMDRITDYKLRPMRLTTPWTGYNHYRGLRGGRWVLETLPAGTMVLVDGSGDPVYKEDCGNRLVSIAKCPLCVVATNPRTVTGNGATRSNYSDSDFWGRHPLLSKFMDFLKALFLWVAGILALLFLLWLLWRFLELLVQAYLRERYVPRTPFVTKPAPAPPPSARFSDPSPAATSEVPVAGATAPSNTEIPYVAFYHGGESGKHKVNFAGHRQVSVMDHTNGRFTMDFKR